MSYAIRKDGQGWRAVNGPADVTVDEVFGETVPAENTKWDGTQWVEDIDRIRANKIAALSDYRYRKETAGIVVNGALIKTDREGQSMIVNTLKGFDFKPEGATIDWLSEDGWGLVNKATLEAIGMAVWNHVEACFQNQKKHAMAISALNTAKEIEAYDITTGWPS